MRFLYPKSVMAIGSFGLWNELSKLFGSFVYYQVRLHCSW